MAGLAKQQEAIAAEGIGLAAISTDSPEDSADLAVRFDISFPLLSDPDATTAAAYGVQHQGEILAVPATFVIARDGTIAWTHIGETKPDRPAIDHVRDQARGL